MNRCGKCHAFPKIKMFFEGKDTRFQIECECGNSTYFSKEESHAIAGWDVKSLRDEFYDWDTIPEEYLDQIEDKFQDCDRETVNDFLSSVESLNDVSIMEALKKIK